MPKVVSAGLVMYRVSEQHLEVLLAHPGGPYYTRKDAGVWSIPKGEVGDGEDLLAAARREFAEETGLEPWGPYVALGAVKYKNHKVVHAWAFEGEFDPANLVSNTFELEWPRGSGRRMQVPEIDRAAWFGPDEAQEKIVAAQRRFLFDLEALVGPTGE
jgi:predicted NUDIX family NTP pyrophosphohydrolase